MVTRRVFLTRAAAALADRLIIGTLIAITAVLVVVTEGVGSVAK